MYADVYFGMIPSVDDRKAYMVFGAATDAAGSIRSDVSVKPKLVAKTIHGCIVLV